MRAIPTILLVEDNEDDVFLFQRVTRKAQIDNPLQVLTDGQQALDYLGGSGQYADRAVFPLPFIVFLDLKLPYVSGFEVLNWIRSKRELDSIVVVVLTSSAEEKDHHSAYTLGARSYLVKPPTREAILELAKSLETYWPAIGATDPFCFRAAGASQAIAR